MSIFYRQSGGCLFATVLYHFWWPGGCCSLSKKGSWPVVNWLSISLKMIREKGIFLTRYCHSCARLNEDCWCAFRRCIRCIGTANSIGHTSRPRPVMIQSVLLNIHGDIVIGHHHIDIHTLIEIKNCLNHLVRVVLNSEQVKI